MKCVDLFAGSGGLSLGFEAAGYQVVAAYECWDAAIECYRANFNHPVLKRDLSDALAAASEIAAFEPDVIMGGPPCQDFSHAGKRARSGVCWKPWLAPPCESIKKRVRRCV